MHGHGVHGAEEEAADAGPLDAVPAGKAAGSETVGRREITTDIELAVVDGHGVGSADGDSGTERLPDAAAEAGDLADGIAAGAEELARGVEHVLVHRDGVDGVVQAVAEG